MTYDTQTQPQFSHDLDPLKVAHYLVSLDSQQPESDVTHLKLQKLLYLIQANYLAATGRRLMDASLEAFEHGPVMYPVYKEYTGLGSAVIALRGNSSSEPLPDDARAFVEQVWNKYGSWSASALRRLTHDQAPWQEAYNPGGYRDVISDTSVRDYFRDEVSLNDRTLHPSAVAVSSDFIVQLDADEDEIVAQAIAALR